MSARDPFGRPTVGSFAEDAQAAIRDRPGYFVWWYTAKSFALVGAIAAAAFFAGKSARRRS